MARGRKRALANAAKLVPADAETPEQPAVTPLLCPSCSAPVPLGDCEVATCSFCQAKVPLPPEYRAIRDAEQQRTIDRDAAEKLYRQLGSPPSAALRAWASGVTVASGTLFGIIMVILTINAAFMLLAGFALELVLHAFAGLLGIDLIDRFGGGTVYAASVVIIVVFGLFPIWLTGYLDSLAQIKHSLQVNLAARPPQKPGFPSTCRGCGAALDVPPAAFGVRCAYCQADNIVSLPAEWITSVGAKQATFHRSIITAVELANKVRAEARAGLPTAAKWSLGAVVVFGLVGRGCSSLDSEDVNTSFRQSMSSPRQMFSYWEPDVGVPIDRMAAFKHLPYTIALRHREVLVWSSNDEGWGGRIEIKNTSSFPFLTRSWERPWLPQTDGTYAASFTAPYTGLFIVKLHSNETSEGDSHLRWRIGLDSTPGIPAPPPITSAAVAPVAADKLDARLAVTSAGRPDLLVTSGDHTGPNKNIVITSISSGKTEKAFDRNTPIVALAMAPDGYLIVTATSDAIVPAGIEKNLFDSGNEAALPDSAGATALVFLDAKIFASGGADGTVKVWNAQSGMELYQLAKLPSAIISLVLSPDGLTLTARFTNGARSFTVTKPTVWAQHG
jgi:LSD1 subclass zinc finger protein